jgi:hypothetical protein
MISLLVSDFRKISVSVPSIPVAVLDLADLPEPFLSGLQKMGVQLLWDAENFHPHADFIAQKMLDRIMRICKKFLKLGFFGHILFLLF